ncbi:transcriptional repressor [Bacteroidia bacterium]|nr:transcriptional repressor [Bacteroidia bacterium]
MDTVVHSQVLDRLQKHGVKPSAHRMAILGYMMQHYNHPCVDEIFAALVPHYPTLSKTTVYNTLQLLEQQGAIIEVDIDKKNTHYDADNVPHAHFMCHQCGRVFDFEIKEKNTIFAKKKAGFVIVEQQVYYKGYCKDCNAAKDN